uniref:Signal peptidase complex subunit 1 n=1 Tax=Haplochromis burtoni TaxID=8153 RepID=A0A3Q3BGK7_HAPBU
MTIPGFSVCKKSLRLRRFRWTMMRKATASSTRMITLTERHIFQDYKGQKLAEQIFQGIILISAAIGFVYGLIIEQFGWTVYIVLAGFAVSCVLTLPPWPMFRRNPLSWQPALPESTAEPSQKPQESTKKKKHK